MDWEKLASLKAVNMAAMGYVPQPAQEPVHAARNNIVLISGGEGSGKSKVTAAEIAARYGAWKLAHIVAYKYESAHNEADYVNEFLSRFGAVTSYSKPKAGKVQLLTREGALLESVSTEAKGAQAVTGTGKTPDVLALVEAGKQSYEVFLACLTRISRSGGLFLLSGTIDRSEPWYADLITRWQAENPEGATSIIIPTWENKLLYPGGRNDPKIKLLEANLPADLFMERLGARPCPPAALVFKEFGFITHVFKWCEFDPNEPVEVWIDPGYSGSHYAVEFVQFRPRAITRRFLPELPDAALLDVWVVDECYLTHAVHEEVIAACQSRPAWQNVRSGVGDVVMSTHPMAGRAPIDVWYEKTGLLLRGRYIEVEDNIDRQRVFLKDPGTGKPRLFFNPRCKGATGEYGRWKRKEIGENLFGAPEKTNCDALKAIGYGLVDNFGFVDTTPPVEPQEPPGLPSMRRMLEELRE